MKKISEQPVASRLYRSTTNRMVAGVAGGLGEYFNIDPNIIRIIFILLGLTNGVGIIIYILMWVLIPTDTQLSLTHDQTIKENLSEIKSKANSVGHSLKFNHSNSKESSRFWWAIIIIVIGFFLLFKNFGLFDNIEIERFWPVILIVLGLIFILKK